MDAESARIRSQWRAAKGYLTQFCLAGPSQQRADAASAKPDGDEIPDAIASSIHEFRQKPWTVLGLGSISSLLTIGVLLVDKYIASTDGWSLYFFYMALTSSVCVLSMVILGKASFAKSTASFRSAEPLMLIPVYVTIYIVREYAYLRAIRSLSIPLRIMLRFLNAIVMAGTLDASGSNVLSTMSLQLAIFSCIFAGAADFFTALYRAIILAEEARAPGATISALLKEKGFEVAASYGWIGLSTCCSMIYFIFQQEITQTLGVKEQDMTFQINVLSIPLLLLASYLVEGLSSESIDKSFPSESRNMMMLGAIFSGLSYVCSHYVTETRSQRMSWQTNGFLKALEIIPITLGSLLFLGLPWMDIHPTILGFAAGLGIFIVCSRRWWSYDMTKKKARIRRLQVISALVIFFSSPAFFGGLHRDIIGRGHDIPDAVYAFVYNLVVGIAIFNVFAYSGGASTGDTAISISLTALPAVFAFLSSPIAFSCMFAGVANMYGAGLSAMAGLLIIFFQVELASSSASG
ncbi:hypothetical protein B0I35DRAFT_515709 [Stachybotrys elegans]|uniref:Uncharacterized protein n=1 Tax=Stachybotrys elegans TaxID=80388 RepID=A0A8K0SI08_9HYPO|nr:hypothetical protein B0I35DRAFT_515709 [Stachybotrys elegans]